MIEEILEWIVELFKGRSKTAFILTAIFLFILVTAIIIIKLK